MEKIKITLKYLVKKACHPTSILNRGVINHLPVNFLTARPVWKPIFDQIRGWDKFLCGAGSGLAKLFFDFLLALQQYVTPPYLMNTHFLHVAGVWAGQKTHAYALVVWLKKLKKWKNRWKDPQAQFFVILAQLKSRIANCFDNISWIATSTEFQ